MSGSKFLSVSELTEPPIPGVRYRVPMVRIDRADLPPGWWPVTGPQHEDSEHILFPNQHWHPDLRFLTNGQVICLTELYGSFKLGDLYEERTEGAHKAHSHVILAQYVRGFVVRPRLCRRLQPVYPRFRIGFSWLPALEAAYKDRELKDCRRCPHRGVPLGSLPRDDQGRAVCPAHGLRWNLTTGRLSPMTDREHPWGRP